jgi:hypothetical protein
MSNKSNNATTTYRWVDSSSPETGWLLRAAPRCLEVAADLATRLAEKYRLTIKASKYD